MYSGVGDGFAKIKASQGLGGFTLGWLPTLVGYSAQGFGKFGFYEIFKDVYRTAAGDNEPKYRTVGFALSSACAEFIADCFLCPWEAVSTQITHSKISSYECLFNNYKI
jgi:solute carrier family 25 phosphate transporter 3